MLRAGRPNRNNYDSVTNELLQERRGNVIDAAGDDDLVERRVPPPAIVTVGVAGADGAIFAVAAGDEAVIKRPRALRQARDDLDRPDVGRQVRKIGGLVA